MYLLLAGLGGGAWLWNKVDDALFDEPVIIKKEPVVSDNALIIGAAGAVLYFVGKKQGWI